MALYDLDTPAIERFRTLLISQYQDSPKFKAYCEILFKKLEELQIAHTQIRTGRNLSSAGGLNLEYIGEYLGAKRTPIEVPFANFGWNGNAVALSFGTPSNAQGGEWKSESDQLRVNALTPLSDRLYRKLLRAKIIINTSLLSVNNMRELLLLVVTTNDDCTITENTNGALSYSVYFPKQLSPTEKELIANRGMPKPAGIQVDYSDVDGPIIYNT